MHLSPFGELLFQAGPHRSRQHDDAILVPLAGADVDGIAIEVHILNAQPAALHKPQPGTVQQLGHEAKQTVRAFDARQNRGRPLPAPARQAGAYRAAPQRVDAAEVDVQHPAI